MQQPETIPLRGGLDLVNPPVEKRPGALIDAINYEPDANGYRRFIGYEAFDGRPRPSDADYWTLPFDAGATEIAEDDAVEGGTSGATATVLHVVLESGTWGGGDAAGYLVLRDLTGTWQDNENIEVSSSAVAVVNGTATLSGAATDANDALWRIEAADARRAAIAAPAGSGPVRGVFALNGAWYCIRDNVGATAAVLFKATASGWAAQSLGRTLAFTSGGASQIQEGDAIEGATSGATATVARVILNSGSWAGGDAAGLLVLVNQVGTFTSGNLNNTTQSSNNVATVAGDSAETTIPPGGVYDVVIHNFTGAAADSRAYLANGVGRARDWCGDAMAVLDTGLPEAQDKPTHVREFSNHLFLQYENGAIQHSETGFPLQWTTTGGAGEISVGGLGRGMVRAATALVIFGERRIDYLVGSDAADWQLLPVSDNSGAEQWSTIDMDRPLYIGDGAVRGLEQADGFGGWRRGTLSRLIEPLFKALALRGATVRAVVASRERDVIRWFYSDGTAIVGYFGREAAEFTTLSLPVTVRCAFEDGGRIMVGADDGKVYEFDVGDTFDGAEATGFVRLAALHLGAPRIKKRWHGAVLELDTTGESPLHYVADFDYGDPDQPPGAEVSFAVAGGGGYWDSFIWDQFRWSAPVVGSAEADISGVGASMSLAIGTEGEDAPSHVLQTLHVYWTRRGTKKRRV